MLQETTFLAVGVLLWRFDHGLRSTPFLALCFSTSLAQAADFRPDVCLTFELHKVSEGMAAGSPRKNFLYKYYSQNSLEEWAKLLKL